MTGRRYHALSCAEDQVASVMVDVETDDAQGCCCRFVRSMSYRT